ncbi:MAG: Ig-like domain-containing protein, partial [Pseudomonadota bacterium]
DPEPEPPVNEAPVAVDDTVSTVYNKTVVVDVLANDSDPDGGTPTLTDVSYDGSTSYVSIVNGQIKVNPLQAVPEARTETITYTIEDADGATDTATLSVEVGAKPGTEPVIEASPFEIFLVDTATDLRIGQIEDGDVINTQGLDLNQLSLEVAAADEVASMRITLDGSSQVENVVPYAAFGDIFGDFKDGTISNGTHSLKAEAFAGKNTNGGLLDEEDITFTFSATNGTLIETEALG